VRARSLIIAGAIVYILWRQYNERKLAMATAVPMQAQAQYYAKNGQQYAVVSPNQMQAQGTPPTGQSLYYGNP